MPTPDVQIGGRDDLFNKAGFYEDGLTVLRFSRKLDTGDARDHVIHSDGSTNQVIFAFHPYSKVCSQAS